MQYGRVIGRGASGLFCAVLGLMTASAFAGGAVTSDVACAHPANAVQRFVCTDAPVRALDAEMAAVYADALRRNPARRAALERDQRNWLAERDDAAHTLLSQGLTTDSAGEALAHVYRGRIDFLRRVGEAAASESPLLAHLDRALPTFDAGETDGFAALGARRAPRREYAQTESVLAHVPGMPDDELLRKLASADNSMTHWRDPVWLDKAGIGGVYVVEGTAHCAYWVMFQRRGVELRSIPAPGTLLGNCNLEDGDLALIGERIAAVRATADTLTPTRTWQVQPWNDDGTWGEPVRWMARFDHVLRVGAATCATGVDCASARAAALDFATRYDREPLPSTLADGSLSAAERASFARMRSLAESSDIARELPQIGASTFSGLDGFGVESSFFPARLGGDLVLGRIGHGRIGWREAGGWLVGFWKLDGDDLVPVAGVVVASDAGRFLVAGPVPPVVHPH